MNTVNNSFWMETTQQNRGCTDISKTVSPQKTEQRFLQHHYSLQTNSVVSACLYQLDDIYLGADDSIKDNQQGTKYD